MPVSDTALTPERRDVVVRHSTVDRVFRGFVSVNALVSLVILALISGFLLYRGFEVFRDFGLSFITTEKWEMLDPADPSTATFGIAAMLVGSVVCSLIAVVFAVPFAIATALFIEYYAPKSVKPFLTGVLDFVAAIPSVIYGVWGYAVLLPVVTGWSVFLERNLGFLPFIDVPELMFGRSPFMAGLLLALMILPIVTSVTREVYSQAPRDLIDATYALGGTRWGAIRTVVMPFGRSGLVGGTMLGLGRALGETVAVYLTLNLVFDINLKILFSAGGNVASMIATKFGEASPYELKGLMAAGLVLFMVTLLVNLLATAVVNRSRKIA